jgi:hypothetical protein
MVDEHNVSLELLVGNSLNQAKSLNQGWPQESGNVLEDLARIGETEWTESIKIIIILYVCKLNFFGQ